MLMFDNGGLFGRIIGGELPLAVSVYPIAKEIVIPLTLST